ncbi:MAG: rhodanese-like domain-containing protein [Magnetococcales bacterium]|nr:rhodanese-like domain-containing protein [Magnetococcales bacterium]
MKAKRIVLALVMLMVVTSVALAEEKPTPPTLPGVETVNTDYVMKAMESGSALIVDARKDSDFAGGHIPGAVLCTSTGSTDIADAEVDATLELTKKCTQVTAWDKAKPVVAYCNGTACWRSPKTVLALTKMGYTQVKWYRDGIAAWKAQGKPIE